MTFKNHHLFILAQTICTATSTSVSADHILINTTPCLKKTVQNCLCQNFFKFLPILIIFGRKMANRLELCEVYSLSTLPHSCHHTTVLSADVPNCYTMLKFVSIRLLTIATSIQYRVPRDLVSLWD